MAARVHSFKMYLSSICWGTRTGPGAGGETVIEAAESLLFWNLPPVEGEEYHQTDKEVPRMPARCRDLRDVCAGLPDGGPQVSEALLSLSEFFSFCCGPNVCALSKLVC